VDRLKVEVLNIQHRTLNYGTPSAANCINKAGDMEKQYVIDDDKVIIVDQDPIGRTPRSNPATYTGVFSYIRDLSTDEAKEVISFFESHRVSKAHFLFIYFAVYRKKQYKEIPFDSKYFENKLVYLCQRDDDFRRAFAGEFWRIAENDRKNKTNHFDGIEKYWRLLFKKYDQQVFDNLYRTLEITLKDPARYKEHKKLLKDALKKEIEYLKTNKISAQLWEPGREIFQTLKEHSDNDFLDVFSQVIDDLDEGIHYFWMKDWIAIFKSIKVTSKNKKLYNRVESKLKNLYPEYV